MCLILSLCRRWSRHRGSVVLFLSSRENGVLKREILTIYIHEPLPLPRTPNILNLFHPIVSKRKNTHVVRPLVPLFHECGALSSVLKNSVPIRLSLMCLIPGRYVERRPFGGTITTKHTYDSVRCGGHLAEYHVHLWFSRPPFKLRISLPSHP